MMDALSIASRQTSDGTEASCDRALRRNSGSTSSLSCRNRSSDYPNREHHSQSPPSLDADDDEDNWHGSVTGSEASDDADLQREVDTKWILNVSVRFSDKEKFYVTYAEQENVWRRVTISYTWKEAPSDSLEADLHAMHSQRQRSVRVYSALRKSLSIIRFYDTITILKLETSGGRLHVHVTEDIIEEIQYPPISAIDHLRDNSFQIYSEREVNFSTHLSGFVYKVNVSHEIATDGKTTTRCTDLVRKEIPSRDTVQDFLYEINSLYAMRHEPEIISFRGIVVDEDRTVIKGLLIDYAQNGTLIDVLDDTSQNLPWARRQKWATQIITGLYKLHSHGVVQGDFTLSNVVIDANDDAKIIDFNRRGCPLGWEPPEFVGNIHSGQRISLYIGEKSDVYQLGMVLWAIARCDDEPEQYAKEFLVANNAFPSDVPHFFRRLIKTCLHPHPRLRTSTEQIISTCHELFPLGHVANFDPVDQDFTTDGADAYDDERHEHINSSIAPLLTQPSPPPLPLSSHAALQGAVGSLGDSIISTFEPHPPTHYDSGFSEAQSGLNSDPEYVRHSESGHYEKETLP